MSEVNAQAATTEQEAQTFSHEYVKELRGEAANYRTQLREVQDQVKAINEAKAAEETAAAEKSGEFETLYKTAQQERDELAAKKAELEEALNSYKERETAERKALIEQVPENLRAHINDATSLDLIKELTAQTAEPPRAGLPGEQQQSTYEEDIRGAKTSQELAAVLAKHGKN